MYAQTVRSCVTTMLLVLSCMVLSLTGCNSGDQTNVTNNTVASSVAVNSVFPVEAKVGEAINVNGQNFGVAQGTSRLNINGMTAIQITSWTDSQIVATVPAGAGTGKVTVTVNGVAGAPGFLIVPWQAENPVNVAINQASNDQQFPQLIPDGTGGAIIVWQDSRSGAGLDIYVQRVNSPGVTQWAPDGVAISQAANGQEFPQLISDGAGGAIIVWQDGRTGVTSVDIYAQRVNSTGVVQWTPDGLGISQAANGQGSPQLISDGTGGAIIAWQDFRSGFGLDIYAQRVDRDGVVQWTTDGVGISQALSAQVAPQLISDGTGGAIIAWQDFRSGATNSDIYAQRVNSTGVVQWTPGGVPISQAANGQGSPQLISDGTGGAIIAWQDFRSGVTNGDIYVQRVDRDGGGGQWLNTDGVPISQAANDQVAPRLISDSTGGAIIVWQDGRSGTGFFDIYAQGITASGRQ